jgi:hypothetical protein
VKCVLQCCQVSRVVSPMTAAGLALAVGASPTRRHPISRRAALPPHITKLPFAQQGRHAMPLRTSDIKAPFLAAR